MIHTFIAFGRRSKKVNLTNQPGFVLVDWARVELFFFPIAFQKTYTRFFKDKTSKKITYDEAYFLAGDGVELSFFEKYGLIILVGLFFALLQMTDGVFCKEGEVCTSKAVFGHITAGFVSLYRSSYDQLGPLLYITPFGFFAMYYFGIKKR